MGIVASGGKWIRTRVVGEALDVGCGEGEVATLLEREGHRVVTADPTRAGALPFDDESFDTVLLGDFLAEWTSHDRPLAEARRVLRPGGRLIVAVPYAAEAEADGAGISLRELLGELAELSVGEIAIVDGRLCVLAERTREKSRAAVWRRALGLAEERLAEREEAAAVLTGSVAELKAGREREERALADARSDVERLETALAAATHRRDLEQEKARLAAAGVAELEQRLERLRQDRDRERTEAERELERHAAEAEREVAKARARLELREEELERSRAAEEEAQKEQENSRRDLAARERDLAVRLAERDAAGKQLAARELELAELREKLAESERELAVRERDLAARVRELGQAGEVLVARERELEVANEQLASKGGELDAAVAELAEARNRLAAREQHLKTAQLGVESRDRRLEVAERAKAARDEELERLRIVVRERERKLALSEARLEKAQQRAESFRGSLVALREGRAYRLMRVLWRLRRPFRRTPRDAATSAPSGQDEADAGPPAAAPGPVAPLAAIADREPSPPRGDRLCVASILDEMSEACFAPECDLVPLALDWREQLDRRRPDLLLVESAWNGNGDEWQYRIAQYPRKDLAGLPALRALIDGCRERGIPTAFWNKEDPVHFDRFSEAASLFDHVFTTDARCVERYRALPGERTVEPLPFAAQPRIHNPVAAVDERSASPCFAGAWYRDRHPERRRSLEALLDAARPRGLVIYDRRFDTDDAAFGFPERFAPHVLGKLPYGRVLDAYKSHSVFLNANSVADSPTMCSRRVFELAACDTAILSTPGAALGALLGEGMVEEADDEKSAAAALERLLGDESERSRRTRAARRTVFAAHTYAERLGTIAATAGIDTSALRREPFAPLGASNGAGAPTNGSANPHPWQLVLQPGLGLAEPALADLAAATTFAEADVIGVRPARNGDAAVEHRHVTDLDPRLLLLRRELVESRGRPTGSPEQIRAQLREWSDDGIRLYAADADLLSV
jgi:spore maturation protein CgeB/SAM-dependent methyltransferase